MDRLLRHDDYTVGWVCALPVELAAAQEMLDEDPYRTVYSVVEIAYLLQRVPSSSASSHHCAR
jgi:hypothetical protein